MAERDSLEVDVLFVGAGPASLAGAIRLGAIVASRPAANSRSSSSRRPAKSAITGSPARSWIPRALDELLPEWRARRRSNRPLRAIELWILTEERKNQSADRAAAAEQPRQVRRLACRRSRSGSPRKPKKPARKSFRRVSRPRTACGTAIASSACAPATRASTSNGNPKPNYEPGADILAKVVVLGEGPRGTLAKQAVPRLDFDEGREPQVYAAGVKELWQLPDDRVQSRHA